MGHEDKAKYRPTDSFKNSGKPSGKEPEEQDRDPRDKQRQGDDQAGHYGLYYSIKVTSILSDVRRKTQ